MFTQQAAVIYKMAVSCITTQLVVYSPVDAPSSVSKSRMKSLSRMRSLVYGSRLKNRALGSGVCIYTYLGGTPSVLELWVLLLWSGGAAGIQGLGGAGHGGGAVIPMHFQRVCGFVAVPFRPGRQPSVWISQTIAGCLSMAASTWLCPGNTTPRFFSSQTSACGPLISCCFSSIAVSENPSLAILAIFKARRMSDYWSCTRPPCLAIVADMLKTYNKSVAASSLRFGYYLNHRLLGSLL